MGCGPSTGTAKPRAGAPHRRSLVQYDVHQLQGALAVYTNQEVHALTTQARSCRPGCRRRSPCGVARLLGFALKLSSTPDHRDSERSNIAQWPQGRMVKALLLVEPRVSCPPLRVKMAGAICLRICGLLLVQAVGRYGGGARRFRNALRSGAACASSPPDAQEWSFRLRKRLCARKSSAPRLLRDHREGGRQGGELDALGSCSDGNPVKALKKLRSASGGAISDAQFGI
ncbi:hypothetical protein HWV62_23901 [Athelia sp. TMB]|nr:hypothetical protein HWV62_23901 [Athelia sp. TMB]